MKIILSGKRLWDLDDGDTYYVLSDYVHERRVPMETTEPEHLMDVEFSDCYIDEQGDFYMPISYKWTYTGSNMHDDPSEYTAQYSREPHLTKEEIRKMVEEHNK